MEYNQSFENFENPEIYEHLSKMNNLIDSAFNKLKKLEDDVWDNNREQYISIKEFCKIYSIKLKNIAAYINGEEIDDPEYTAKVIEKIDSISKEADELRKKLLNTEEVKEEVFPSIEPNDEVNEEINNIFPDFTDSTEVFGSTPESIQPSIPASTYETANNTDEFVLPTLTGEYTNDIDTNKMNELFEQMNNIKF